MAAILIAAAGNPNLTFLKNYAIIIKENKRRKIPMKMYEVIALQDFYAIVQEIKMPIKTTYKLTRLMRRVEEEVQFYQKEFNNILSEFALKENGNFVYSNDNTSIRIIPGKEEECAKRISDLREIEVSLEDFQFEIEEFENLNLTISQMNSILPLIKN
jgi:hypothetical protein